MTQRNDTRLQPRGDPGQLRRLSLELRLACHLASLPQLQDPIVSWSWGNSPPMTSSPPASALSAADQQFVSDMRSNSAFNFSSGITDAQIATFGESVCTQRQTGLSQVGAVSYAQTQWTNTSPMLGDAMIRHAETDLCPKYLPAQTVTYIVTGTPGAAQVTYASRP